jgi:hypothetical protein
MKNFIALMMMLLLSTAFLSAANYQYHGSGPPSPGFYISAQIETPNAQLPINCELNRQGEGLIFIKNELQYVSHMQIVNVYAFETSLLNITDGYCYVAPEITDHIPIQYNRHLTYSNPLILLNYSQLGYGLWT